MNLPHGIVGLAFLIFTPSLIAQAKPKDEVSLQEKRLAVVPETFRCGPVVLSQDGRTAAYAASKGGKTYVFVGDRKGEGFDAVSNIEFSTDGKSLIYVATKGNKQLVVMDERKGEEYDRIISDRPSLLSPILLTLDGKTAVYVAMKDGKQFVVVGEKRGESFDRIVGLTFCADGKTPLYFGQTGGRIDAAGRAESPVRVALVVGEKKGQEYPFDRVDVFPLIPRFNTGLYLGHVGQIGSGGKTCVVVGDKKGPEFDGIYGFGPVLRPDGKTVAYGAYENLKPNRRFSFVMGEEKFEDVRLPLFSPDGKAFAFERKGYIERAVSFDDGQTFPSPTVVGTKVRELFGVHGVHDLTFGPDNRTIAYKAFQSPGGGSRLKEPKMYVVVGDLKGEDFDDVQKLTFSPDGKVAYWARLGEELFVVMGDSRGEPIDLPKHHFPQLNFSADGKTVIYAVRDNQTHFVVVGGRKGEVFQSMGPLIFSPDGKNVAYAAARAGKWQVVVGGKNGDLFDEVGPVTFTRDGKSAVYRARKGGKALLVAGRNQGEEFDEILSEPVLSADGRKAAYGARKDRELWWKVLEVKP